MKGEKKKKKKKNHMKGLNPPTDFILLYITYSVDKKNPLPLTMLITINFCVGSTENNFIHYDHHFPILLQANRHFHILLIGSSPFSYTSSYTTYMSIIISLHNLQVAHYFYR